MHIVILDELFSQEPEFCGSVRPDGLKFLGDLKVELET
jgi:hypothetical protein